MMNIDIRTNARLIDAAPDLLEAAKKLLALMDEEHSYPECFDETPRTFLRYEFEDLRSAVVKAERGQP